MNPGEMRQRHARALGLRVDPYVKTARTWIDTAIEDAETYARAALMGLVANQPAFVELARSGPMIAAGKRLDNLGQALRQIVHRARIEFYVESYKMHRPYLDGRINLMDVGPTREGAIAVRDAMIGGKSLDSQIIQVIDSVKFMLNSAVASGRGDEALRGWRAMVTDQLQARISTWIMDSSRAIHSAVSWSLLRPELRPNLKKKTNG